MITIKNIQKINGETCLGRWISSITEEHNRLGEHFYSFHFGPINNGLEWNKPIEVRLNRECMEDRHYLFVMGLEMRTGLHIKQEDVRNKEILLSKIEHVMNKAKHWWEYERD